MTKDTKVHLQRRVFALVAAVVGFLLYSLVSGAFSPVPQMTTGSTDDQRAAEVLEALVVRDDETTPGYKRDLFGNGWGTIDGCDTRNVILARDLSDVVLDGCLVLSGKLDDLYTGETIYFTRGENSSAVQIDHVVALSNGWQSGMHERDSQERHKFANDPINLLAVDGPANMEKSDFSADHWLPSNRAAHCIMVNLQISVKYKYNLSITAPEKKAMQKVLRQCPDERILR